ncbi:MAG: PIN domain-containing protein [Kiritimatiellae bacterium]|nr:PIN domain-containing protein [Kiritimatiellia bacterium]
MDQDVQGGGLSFLPYNLEIVRRIRTILANAPKDTFLRAADALHLACAAVNGFQEVYSHDKHFLQAAPLFGLTGMDVIS